jgi:hypothetical protein
VQINKFGEELTSVHSGLKMTVYQCVTLRYLEDACLWFGENINLKMMTESSPLKVGTWPAVIPLVNALRT